MVTRGEIIDKARERANRHTIAEAELMGLSKLYGYSRIENTEISSFIAGAEFVLKKEGWIRNENPKTGELILATTENSLGNRKIVITKLSKSGRYIGLGKNIKIISWKYISPDENP